MPHNRKIFAIVFPVQKGKDFFIGPISAFLQLCKQTKSYLFVPPTDNSEPCHIGAQSVLPVLLFPT